MSNLCGISREAWSRLAVIQRRGAATRWWESIEQDLNLPPPPTSKPHLPKWLHPPTADEIARCRSAHDISKWKPCLDERKSRIFNLGPACCSYVAGTVDGCFSQFPPKFQDRIYPPSLKKH
ncbi:hypothetical protein TIFTF001_028001 [Ficus carica]|uniref:Prolamin-like domain-containing protein n=1 Tax=Ficus carica TaxID=3494 RepID=A0AA88DP41_FICCA|nr:hypothetical protein TIFTF001_028001 [Ficus carica]